MIEQQITPQEAEIQYQHLRRETSKHAASCYMCDALSVIDEICYEAKELWRQRREALEATLTEDLTMQSMTNFDFKDR